MRKYLFIALFICSHLLGFAQIDALKRIDSLKNQCHTLKSKSLVDAYNTINNEYWHFREYWGKENAISLKTISDSIERYATLAKNESEKNGYKYGRAKAILNLSRSEQLRSVTIPKWGIKSTADLQKWEKQLNELIPLIQELHDNELSGHTYYLWGNFYESKEDKNKSLENYKRAISYLLQTGKDDLLAIEICFTAFQFSMERADYDQAFEYGRVEVDLANKLIPMIAAEKSNPENMYHRNFYIQYALYQMSELYQKAGGDNETAMSYLKQIRSFGMLPNQNTDSRWTGESDIGELFVEMKQFDSALYYLKPFAIAVPGNFSTKYYIGRAYTGLKQYDSAWHWLKLSLDQCRQKKNNWALMDVLTAIAKFYMAKGDYKTAIKYAQEEFDLAKKMDVQPQIINGYELLSNIYHHIGKNDLAYSYLLQYMTMRDSVINRQFLWKLNTYKNRAEEERKTSQINLLNKDNQLKKQQLKQEATLRNSLVAGLVLLLLLGIFIFRNLNLKRKTALEKQRLENGKKQTELEMQALRAQMNPHFIFNCLSSINRFILKNEGKTASNYLTRFSRLMRMVLMNSQKPLISLDDELQMLEIYLEMERLRFKNSFDYAITFLNVVDSDNVFIPPLLLQPFCENAIWHGLMHKEGQGRLDIELSMEGKVLTCAITDNGVGREKAEEMKSKTAEKEKSMGLKITTERLALLNKEKGSHTFYEIEDMKDENGSAPGTRVILKISFKESVEETV
jgi:tetratricopeptide (TPR) repeat protein